MSTPPTLLKKTVDKSPLLDNNDANKYRVKNMFFNKNKFVSGKNLGGGGPLANSKKYSSSFAEDKGNKFYFSFYKTNLMGDIKREDRLSSSSENNSFQSNDFSLANNDAGLKMINRLTRLGYKVNVPYFLYVLENLHILVEIGILPPLLDVDMKKSKEDSSVLEKWLNFQRCQSCLSQSELETKGKKSLFPEKYIFFIGR